jgi:hypothetical protein
MTLTVEDTNTSAVMWRVVAERLRTDNERLRRELAGARPSAEVLRVAVEALRYFTPHERTGDNATVALTAGKMRKHIADISAALSEIREETGR